MDRGRPEVKEWSGEGMVEREGGPLADSLVALLKNRLGERMRAYRIPPPVFTHMRGEFVAFDEEKATLTVRFPLLEAYLNPYDAVQGGVIAAVRHPGHAVRRGGCEAGRAQRTAPPVRGGSIVPTGGATRQSQGDALDC
jgi:hypothetical protein